MCRSSSINSTFGAIQFRTLWNSAASASGHQNAFPSASIAETPLSGTSTHVGPLAALVFSAIPFPSRSISSGVVRMSVTVGLCW